MTNAKDDIVAVEAAADLLVQGLSRTDISSVTDLVTDLTVILPPGRRTAKGKRVLDFLRNFSQNGEGFRLMSSQADTLAPGVVRDVGTLSIRRKRDGERTTFRYLMLWLKGDAGWTLASMTWNRDVEAEGGRGRGRQPPPAAASDDGLGDM